LADTELTWEALPANVQERWQEVLRDTPVPPASFGDVTHTVSRELEPEEWARIVSGDLVLSGKVLSVANAAVMGLVKPISDVRRAVVHLGSNLTRIIVVAYFVEGLLGRWETYPRAHFTFVRHWAASASVLAHQLAGDADSEERETISTATLLARLGSLLLGLVWPAPTEEYAEQPDEVTRLSYEMEKWEISSPALGSRLARHWGLPDPLPELIGQQCRPLLREMPADETSYAPTAIAVSLVLGLGFLHTPQATVDQLLGHVSYLKLKDNVQRLRLMAACQAAWADSRTQKELAVITES